ncbi:MAG: FKBP-type peptidyl-prolyl cis-trans isomerase [Alphaproteobacteria bacterium]|nr:FKBP-type peptidyl-prolyl cis-trans isomerase [Alphaproteobacteria bacterium]
MRALGWVVALVAIGAAVFFWRQGEDLKSRLAGLAAATSARDADLARLQEIDGRLNDLDRGFSRGLNGQDMLARDFARLATGPDQAELRAGIERRLAALKTDLEAPAKIVRDWFLAAEPPGFKLDPARLTDAANAAFLAGIDADAASPTLPRGLRYTVLKAVEAGRRPAPDDEVTVNYRGSFIDGTEFDSSFARNAPATFNLSGLIAGWVEGIPLMKEGESFQLVLPYDLAYGAAGRGSIPPRQTLVFQVDLLRIGK